MPTTPIYMDNNATTLLDGRVFNSMLPYFKQSFGNPSSGGHFYGFEASEAVECSRMRVAESIGCHPSEVVFTSGATEANNLAIKGMVRPKDGVKGHLITSAIEHKSVLSVLQSLEQEGYELTLLQPGKSGVIEVEEVREALRPDTCFVSIMMVNNEIGTINPIGQIAKILQEKQITFHTDAVQALSKMPLSMKDLGVDMASFSGHKIYGPKGAGVLFVKQDIQKDLKPLIEGGGQENNLRSGTLNVPAIVGFAEACVIATELLDEESKRIHGLRERLYQGICSSLKGVQVNGCFNKRVCGNLNFSIKGVDGEMLLLSIQTKIALSSMSACSSGGKTTSHVLDALGVSKELQSATLRFGVGRFTSKEEVEACIKIVVTEVNKSRKNKCLGMC